MKLENLISECTVYDFKLMLEAKKRGSGLKKICKETQKLMTYRDERKPIFKSTATQFMTIIYSMEYDASKQSGAEETGTKPGLSWEQVGTKPGLSWDEVERLFVALQQPRSMSELKELYGWTSTTKFKAKYITPLIEDLLVGMSLPEKPTSPNQKYYLTDKGKSLLVNEMGKQETLGKLKDEVSRLISNLNEDEKRIALELLQGNTKR